MKLNDIGKQAIINFLLKHHIVGSSIIKRPSVLENWFHTAEIEYNSGVDYPVIEIDAGYSVKGLSISLLMYDEWMSEVVSDTRIGISDTVRPELLNKKVRDWC